MRTSKTSSAVSVSVSVSNDAIHNSDEKSNKHVEHPSNSHSTDNNTTTNNRSGNDDDDDDDEIVAASSNAAVSQKDVLLYFLCGIASDAIPGFFFSSTIIIALNLPHEDPTLMAICAQIGGVLGTLLSTFVLPRYTVTRSPNTRVILNAVVQFLGILLSWLLKYPYNIVFGTSILTAGFVGMLVTIMPLSNYAGLLATRSYQAGTSAAPIFGLALVEIGNACKFTNSGYFAMVLTLPIITTLCFLLLDHSMWVDNKNDDDDDDDDDNVSSRAKRTTVTTITTTNKSSIPLTTESFRASIHNDDDEGDLDHTATKNAAAAAITTGPDDDEEQPYNNHHNNNNNKKQQQQLTRNDYILAVKELSWKYFPIYIVSYAIARTWYIALYQPSLISSSTTYAGYDATEGIHTSTTVMLVGHIGVFIVGLTIFTPLGYYLPQQFSAYWFWIPNTIQMILAAVAIMGIVYGVFPPVPVITVYCFEILLMASFFVVQLYVPLFVRSDPTLSSQYVEFQQQILIMLSMVVYLVTNLGCLWISKAVLEGCQESYENNPIINNNSTPTSCTFFK